MRGEDNERQAGIRLVVGSPPHARGRRDWIHADGVLGRITPACAGKTAGQSHMGGITVDHPRMRGEDVVSCAHLLCRVGSPPHARGRLSAARMR